MIKLCIWINDDPKLAKSLILICKQKIRDYCLNIYLIMCFIIMGWYVDVLNVFCINFFIWTGEHC